MLAQLVCYSDKDPKEKAKSEIPFDFFRHKPHLNQVILVPSFEDYNEVQKQLLINGATAKVICIPPPSQYQLPVGQVPYALVTDDYIAKADSIDTVASRLTYYFEKKDAATTNKVHE